MNKSSISGWRDVFTFTLVQTLKSKAFIISYIIFLLLAIASMPVMNKFMSANKDAANGPSPVRKVYVKNETTLPAMEFSEVLKDDRFRHITFESLKEGYDTVAKRIEESEKDSVILMVKESEGTFALDFIKASSGPVKDDGLQQLTQAVGKQFDLFKIEALGITDKQLAMIKAKVKTAVSMADVNGVEIIEKDTSISSTQYWFIYGILFITMMVNIMASTQVATAIVTEKSTRVIEYLLISVKPLAIMIGKIMAMLTAVLLQFVTTIILLFASNKLTQNISTEGGDSVLSHYLPKDIFQNLNMVNILLCLILIILGMIFYATLAGLAGATVSRIEEISEGLTLFTLTNMVGVYIGMAASGILMGAGINGFVIFSFLFPLSSPFILPGAILIGKASLPLAAGSIVLQVLFIALLLKFVAKIYATLIMHNGSTIKVKQLFKISKSV
jgi:ABC-2 type transport system permease protein